MEKLIKKYIKKQDKKTLHKLRIECRKKLSFLQKKKKSDKGAENILKKSSGLRDTDVLLKICKNKKIKKYLLKKRKVLNEKFLNTLKNIDFNVYKDEKIEKTDLKRCKELLKTSFLNQNDIFLHEIRLKIKLCRYTNPHYEKEFKKIQDALGKAHDYYKCEKLLKKFKKSPLKAYIKKIKYISKAEKTRKNLLSILH